MQKIYDQSRSKSCYVGIMESRNEMVILTGLTLGEAVKFKRLHLKLRQLDVASQACVTAQEVIRLEKDGFVLPVRRSRILAVLGLDKRNENT